MKIQRKLANVFGFTDCLLFDLASGVVYKYTCGRCSYSYYDETDRVLKVRSGEYIKISQESAIRYYLLNWKNIPCFDEFTVLAYGHHKYSFETKESLLIKRERSVLNKNSSSVILFLFDNNKSFEFFIYTTILFYYVIWYVGYS